MVLKRRLRSRLSLNLFARVIGFVSIGLALMFAGFTLLSLQAVRESTERTLQERLLIAQISANRVDDLLQQTITVLQTVVEQNAIDPDQVVPNGNERELRTISQQLGDFVLHVGVVDRNGKIVRTEPDLPNLIGTDLSANRYVVQVLSTGRSVVSGFFAPESVDPSAAILFPTKRADGSVNGLVYAAVNLRHPSMSRLLGPLGLGKTGYAEIVDEDGFPLASTWEQQSWRNCRYGDRFATLIRDRGAVVGQCHDCHNTSNDRKKQDGVMAFAALSTAPWGIVVQQDEAEAFAYSRSLQQNLFFFGATAFLVALFVAWALTRSVVRPIQNVTGACQRIAAGDLAEPIPVRGSSEISTLARSFNVMRQKLKSSLEEIQQWNQELEGRVDARTRELADAETSRRELLRKLVVAQEDERRAVARELHDETSQALTALVVKLETVATAPTADVAELKNQLHPIQAMTNEMLREVQRIIRDLRPAILDDLGLMAAIDWFAESRLASAGIRVALETIGVERRLPSEVETVIFRIAQEAINNIARHARARNASITLDFREPLIILEVEDDGCGFSADGILASHGTTASFGLTGMRERVTLFSGAMQIHSQPGQGTRLVVAIPVEGADHAKDTRSNRG
ncbi:MAG: HAMP domain-containing protein [Chloroflexi bacterium]|nr:HAMP domain-containing protein [Chloroflexota bacterium]